MQTRKLGRKGRIIAGHLGCRIHVIIQLPPHVVRSDNSAQLRVPTVDALRPRRIRVEIRVGELLLKLVMLGQQSLN